MALSFVVTTKQKPVVRKALKTAKRKITVSRENIISLDADTYRALYAILQDARFKANLESDEKDEAVLIQVLHRLDMLSAHFPIEPKPVAELEEAKAETVTTTETTDDNE